MTERVAEFFPDMPRNIRLLRKERGLSQTALVGKMANNRYGASMSQPYLARLECSSSDKMPSLSVLAALADALETTIDWLVRGTIGVNDIDFRSVLTAEQRNTIAVLVSHFEQVNTAEDSEGVQGYIYFVASHGSDRIKIGYSAEPEKRANTLMSSSPFATETLKIIEGTREDEAALHRRFAHLRVHREWFTDCDELREYIATLE